MAGPALPPTVALWVQGMYQAGKSKNTCQSYSRALAHLVAWWADDRKEPFDAAAVEPAHIVAWKEHQLSVEGAKPATVNLRLVAVSRFLKWATQAGFRREPSPSSVGTLRLPPRDPQGLDDAALACLRQQAAREGDLRNIALLEVLVGTGMRVSEVLALRWPDVTLGEDVSEAIVRGGRSASSRRVPLTGRVRRALRAYVASQEDRDHENIWIGQRGALRDRTAVFRVLKQWAWKAGLNEEAVSPEALRHTFAKRYLATNPGDMRGLAQILGTVCLAAVSAYAPAAGDLASRMERAEEVSDQPNEHHTDEHVDGGL